MGPLTGNLSFLIHFCGLILFYLFTNIYIVSAYMLGQTKFELDIRSKKHKVQSMGIALRNFICTLSTEFIQPNKDNRSHLKLPPWEYPIIRKLEWKQFVYKVLGPEFEVKCFTIMFIHCYLEDLFVLINDN